MKPTNDRFDVSELVLNSIVRGRKKAQLEEKRNQNKDNVEVATDIAQDKLDEKANKREELQNRLKEQQEARAKKREELKQRQTLEYKPCLFAQIYTDKDVEICNSVFTLVLCLSFETHSEDFKKKNSKMSSALSYA